MGEYTRQVLGPRLGTSELFINMQQEDFGKYFDVYTPGAIGDLLHIYGENNTTYFTIQEYITTMVDVFIGGAGRLKNTRKLADGKVVIVDPGYAPDMSHQAKHHLINSESSKLAEAPSHMCKASARALGRLASSMAMRGKFEGKTILSENTWEQLHSEATITVDHMMSSYSSFTKGGLGKFGMNQFSHVMSEKDNLKMTEQMYKGKDGWYGWFGFGGSLMQWHPELQIGFAYVPTDHICFDISNAKGTRL